METKIARNTSKEDAMGTSLPAECGDDDVGVQDYFRDHATASSTFASVTFLSSNCRPTRSARLRNRSSSVPAEIFLITVASGPLVTMRRSSSCRSRLATISCGRLISPALSILMICSITSLLAILNDTYQIRGYFANLPAPLLSEEGQKINKKYRTLDA